MQIKVRKADPKAVMPKKAHVTDAGYDIVAVTKQEGPGPVMAYSSGLQFEFPPGVWAELRARSSVWKTGMFLANGVGTIDNGYTGTVDGVFWRIAGGAPYEPGDRFAQLIFHGVNEEIEFVEVEELAKTDRNEGGFGSTGR